MLATVLASLLLTVMLAVASPAGAQDLPDIADPMRKPGGINPAEIDWRCSIMAGRTDRAFIPCFLFSEPEARFILGSGLVTGRTAAVQFIIDNPPPARGPLRQYTEEESRALGLFPPSTP